MAPYRARSRPWWSAPGRHSSWPYLLLTSLVLGGAVGVAWPYNPAAWSLAGQVFPRSEPQAVLVDIDPVSLADYGPLNTWTPAVYRAAAEQLQQAGARAIGVDVLLDPARPGAAELNQVFSQAGVVLAAWPGDPLTPPAAVADRPVRSGVSALDRDSLGMTYAFRTGYRTAQGELLPTLAWQLARAAGAQVPLDTRPRFLHRFSPAVVDTRLSFRDVATGSFRYADVQDKVVVIGQASPDPARPTGSELQARAVASLLVPPYLSFPVWAAALMAALVAGLSFILNRSWGLLIALLMPLLLLALWRAGVAFPGLTLATAALVGLALAAAEDLLARRGVRLHSTLGEQVLGTRAGLSQAVETLLSAPSRGQAYLFLIRLEGYATLEERFGHEWAEEGVDQGLRRLRDLGPQVPNLEGFGFRWERDELVFIVDPVHSDVEARDIAAYFAFTLNGVSLRGQSLRPSAGYACVQALPGTPLDEVSAQSLIEAARQTLLPAPLAWT
ncbi:putative Chase2 sensor protein [Deinococcus proteolyticus MRP]|uniref:Putative Chase2 sensor protein n=1 Tax=Deinococcus proteolyticus (strain ATCC 35074 / DSM 20540 / JCM 6276 / NBRC 101906 / NCIMB 13154 / VKM Ac-1939 / CCM 2703 / MRP) TaxID=693977 RepID=F0RN68_DEIPM|nr:MULTISPECIES: CHASE2 domain-containing protein [Deinococcus]ADY26210.1 putative Chase2 sensor protein [Deinococcus proteolyticus MRP]MCY1702325.1 CHASE2 domain-containing protein [Deinococcus sp. SL84]